MTEPSSAALLQRCTQLLERVERLLPAAPPAPDLDAAIAFRWRVQAGRGWLQALPEPSPLRLADLLGIERQKLRLQRNTEQFLQGRPANNVLLWGARGTGKSSLLRALLCEYAAQGLRVVEVDKQHLVELPDIVEQLRGRAERYLIYCDDLSFEADDPRYKALKVVLDGSLAAAPENVLVYATSNRRHLLPEFQHENQQAQVVGTEIHHGEAVEEKISLSERFGLWLAFHPFNQEQYLAIVQHWLGTFGIARLDVATREEALRWALARGSRSGRVAWQFARDCAGRAG